jgi:putative peptide maturation dehydrogenase
LTRHARRAAHVFFRLSDDLLPDFDRLLRGEVELEPQTRLLAVSVLTGEERAVSTPEYELLEHLPKDRWTRVEDVLGFVPALDSLAEAGLIVVDDGGGRLAELRRLDDKLRAGGWDPYGALYHSRSRWRDVDAGEFLDTGPARPPRHEPPPPAFHSARDVLESHNLPLPDAGGELFRVLRGRRTTRGLDSKAPLEQGVLATLLYYTFGCHGFARVDGDLVLLKRTSPSGGSLHPIEAYPLVLGVEGIRPGIYHYRGDRHALELLQELEPEAARERLVTFTAGQTYLSAAQVLVIVTARFARSFWKYRAQSRSYAVVLMDAAHVSQTFYLVCAQLGLGAFVSAAVNAANIEEALGLDGYEEGAVAVCGCGRPARERSAFDLDFEPYVPRETVID